jgi:glucosylceramidase
MKFIRPGIFMAVVLSMSAIMIACSKKSGATDDGAGTGTTPVTPVTPVKSDMAMWLTLADQSQLFSKQNVSLAFNTSANANPTINVDTTQTYQTIDGFGFALTGGSAYLINSLDDTKKTALINELFGTDGTNIGISYIRITIGASDMSASPFSYDDVPNDVTLTNFSLDKEKNDLIPVLQKIIAVNPNIKYWPARGAPQHG